MRSNNVKVTAGSGDDTFYVSGNKNQLNGAGGDDYFVVSGKENIINGGTGTNYVVDTSVGGTNSKENWDPNPNSGTIDFSLLNQQEAINVNGKKYAIKNINVNGEGNPTNSVAYSYNYNTGEILFIGSNVTITAANGVSHSIRIDGNNNLVNGGNLADSIVVQNGSGNIIKGNNGNDMITLDSENNSALGGDGNDTININASTDKKVDGGEVFQRNVLYDYGKNTAFANVVRPIALNVDTQVGSNAKDVVSVGIEFELGALDLDFSSREKAVENIEQIDEILERVTDGLSKVGSQLNRLDSIYELNQNESLNLAVSKSIIKDADIGQEATLFVQNQIRQNIQTSLFAQSSGLRTERIMALIGRM